MACEFLLKNPSTLELSKNSKAFLSQSELVCFQTLWKEKKRTDPFSLAFTSPGHGVVIVKDGLEQMLVHCCWMVLADPDLIQATVVTLSSSITALSHSHSQPLLPGAQKHARLTMPSGASSIIQKLFSLTVFLEKNLWTFCGSLVFGPESCFSQGSFILLDYFVCPTPGPYSVPLWSTLYQKDSSTLNFEK